MNKLWAVERKENGKWIVDSVYSTKRKAMKDPGVTLFDWRIRAYVPVPKKK